MKSINFVFISGVLIFLLLVLDSVSSAGGIGTVGHGGNCEYVDPADLTDTANSGKMCKDVGDKDLVCEQTPDAKVGTPPGTTADVNWNPVEASKPKGICVCKRGAVDNTWIDGGCKPLPRKYGSLCSVTRCKSEFKCGVDAVLGYGKKEDTFSAEFNAATPPAPGKLILCVCAAGDKKVYDRASKQCVRHSNPTKTIDVIHGGDCTDVTGCKPIFECSIGGTAKTDGTTADAFGEKWDVAKHSGNYGKCMCKNAVFKTDKCEAAKDKTDGKDKDKDKSKSSGSDRILYPSSCMFLQLAIAAIGSLLLLGMS